MLLIMFSEMLKSDCASRRGQCHCCWINQIWFDKFKYAHKHDFRSWWK